MTENEERKMRQDRRSGFTFDEFVDELAVYADPEHRYSREELLRLAADAVETIGAWSCFTCQRDTFAIGEDYYVVDELWYSYGVEGMLCIGCLEARLGRQLIAADFKPGFAASVVSGELARSDYSRQTGFKPSERLVDRCNR
jgi:hypothetical protein